MPSGPTPTIIFLHIPKTGGSTLRSILERQFRTSEVYLQHAKATAARRHTEAIERAEEGPPRAASVPYELRERELRQLPRHRLAGLRLVAGHFWFGVHEALPQPSTYLTILRDPVERVLSLYDYRVRSQGLALALEQYLAKATDPALHDQQTRLLSRPPAGVRPGGEADAMLASAKRNLAESFELAGLTERFDETLALLGDGFGWSRLWYLPRNVSNERVRADDLPDRERRRIEDLNARDLELYAFAAALFDRRVQEAGEDLERRLQSLRRMNRAYQAWPLAARAWERLRRAVR